MYMKNVAIYARVSTQQQEEKHTIDSQLFKLREMALNENLVKEYIDNGWSGASLARPALDELRDDAKEKRFDTLYVYDPDRFSRNHIHLGILLEEFKKNGVTIVFALREYKDNPEDKLLFGMQGLIAEYEREKIKERTRRGKMQKARQGFVMSSHAPFGYNYIKRNGGTNGSYAVNLEEKKTVELIFKLFLEIKSIRGVVTELYNRNIKPRNGKKYWAKSTIAKILSNPTYTGTTYYNKHYSYETDNGKKYKKIIKTGKKLRNKEEWVPIPVEPLIEKELLYNTQEILNFNKANIRSATNTYLLTGLLKCGKCGSKYTGEPNKGHPVYRCNSRQRKNAIEEKCLNKQIQSSLIEETVWSELKKALLSPSIVLKQLNSLSKKFKNKKRTFEDSIQELDNLILNKIESKQKLLKAFSNNIIDEKDFNHTVNEINQEIKRFEKEKSEIQSQIDSIDDKPKKEQDIKSFLKTIKASLEKTNPQEKKNIVRLICEEIQFNDRNVLIKAIIPSSSSLSSTMS